MEGGGARAKRFWETVG